MSDANLLLAIGASDIGGGQKVFLSLAQELHRRGSPPVVVLPPGPLVELVKPFAARLYVVDLSSLISLPQIAGIVRRERTATLNPHLTKCSLLFAVVNIFFRRRLFCTLHNAVTHAALTARERRIYPALYWLLQRLSTGILVTSEQNKRHMVDVAGMDPQKVTAIRTGIDVEGFARQREPRGSSDTLVIGAVGRLSPEKGHVFLVRALSYLRGIDCLCLLVGDGPLRAELEQVAVQEGVADRIRFLGFQENVAGVMSQMDVVVMPSLDESFGLTILEAFALEKLVIASDVGGIPELVQHGRTGILVPARDSAALAAAIEYALTHRTECQQMARDAYAFAVNTFTTSAMVDRFLAALNGHACAGPLNP